GVPMIVKAILLLALGGVDKKAPQGRAPAGPAAAVKEPERSPGPPIQAAPVRAQPRPPARPPLPAAEAATPLPLKPHTSVDAYLHRNFNVLTPRVRKRLLKLKKLGVSNDDIEAIAQELVHHPEFQQLDIVNECIQLNKVDEVDPVHVLLVRNMSYDENTKKWMVDQLRSIPDKDVPAFIDEMERNQPTR
ncbi:MAG: hypothetical protein JW839_17400, partial [Candidatus Lokiarchaeota archaeon]|nr:hypothetical protein [Candidatus Lokiarchaeota archaeon]